MACDLHPDIEALAPLLGTWSGRGSGVYPTIESFEYLEEVVFSHVGKPFLIYTQKTRSVADGARMHAETGYLRVSQPGRVEWILAHPNGISEIEAGTFVVTGEAIDIEMATSAVGVAPTAKEVTDMGRRYRVDGDELSYALEMAAVGQPMQNHLTAVLNRTG